MYHHHHHLSPTPQSSDRKPWLEADFELVMPLLFVVVVRWFLEYEAATYVLFDNFLGGKILEEVQTSEKRLTTDLGWEMV